MIISADVLLDPRRFLLDFLFFTWRFVPPGREPAEVFRAYFLTWGIVRAAAFARSIIRPITETWFGTV